MYDTHDVITKLPFPTEIPITSRQSEDLPFCVFRLPPRVFRCNTICLQHFVYNRLRNTVVQETVC